MNKQLGWKFGIVAAVTLVSFLAMWPPQEKIKLGLDLKGGTSFLLKMDTSQIDPQGRGAALNQATEILRKRLDEFHVAEPLLQPVGNDRILVQLPGLKEEDRQEARRRIEKTAYLEFRLVNPNNDELQGQALTDPRFRPPLGYTNLTHTETRDGRAMTRSYYVKLKPEQGLTGKYVERAYVAYDEIGRPYIALTFNKEGGDIFGRITSANVGHQLAIILDGELQSAPVIQDAILGGRAQITGQFSLLEAQRLASTLENPLQAPVKVLEERGLDPSLGKDSIHSGVTAAVIGAAAVVSFMLIYYLAAGAVADAALALNILITVGVLAFFKWTLTLPGIAGIVLSIGMSVDTNVLIFERVREELAAGKPLRTAIAAAYERAFRVIFDAHLTAILTGIILIMMGGSGQVKGFGVTLVIGLLANLFSGVFVTRIVFDWLVVKGWLKSFKMLHVFRLVPHINFLGVWKLAFAISWILIAAGMWSFVQRGGLKVGEGQVYGIDFKGGDEATLSFAEKVDVTKLRDSVNKIGVEAFIQYEKQLTGAQELLALRLPEHTTDKVVSQLQQDFPEAKFVVTSTDHVGAVVGKELLQQAMIATGVALVAIMIYLAFRFGEFSYGLGGLVSLVHDVLMTVGWFCLTGRTFSLPVVAAVLTLIGYSINDTIVVFDRIREKKKLSGGRLSYFDLINRSVNETLSRTILTAGTVFMCAVSLYVFGGRVINDFAFCFMVGVLTGTYSSIYIASPCVLWFHRTEGMKTKSLVKKAEPAKA